MLNTAEVRTTVHEVVSGLLRETQPEVPALTGREELHELGLSSLTLARLILALEDVIGVDPFEQDVVISDVRRLDDLVAVYAHSLAASTGP